MIQARCRLLRIQRLEALAFEQILTEPGAASDPDARLLSALCASGNALDKLQRYAATAERSYYKALRELRIPRAKPEGRVRRPRQHAERNHLRSDSRARARGSPNPREHPSAKRTQFRRQQGLVRRGAASRLTRNRRIVI